MHVKPLLTVIFVYIVSGDKILINISEYSMRLSVRWTFFEISNTVEIWIFEYILD